VSSGLFAEPMSVNNPSECVFYHSLDLPVSGPQKGHWDLRGQFDRYINSVKLSGRTLLDVGTASGFLSFEAEKLDAARVVSVDIRGAECLDRLPFVQNAAFRNRAQWEEGANKFHDAIKRSYWLAHREFRSKAEAFYGNAYELPESLGQFDVVLVAQILVHLRDAIRALTSIARRCRETLIIAEGMRHEKTPVSYFLGRANNPDVDWTFWHHSEGFYTEVLAMLGFRCESTSTNEFRCNIENRSPKITTMVFRRVRS
jgi:SAM-dependent methyltransferase